MVIQQKNKVSNIKNPYKIRVFYDILFDNIPNKLSYKLAVVAFIRFQPT